MPKGLLNITWLKRTAELLVQDKYSITEISTIVGFNSATHFERSFLTQLGTTPSIYLQKNKKVQLEN